MLPEYGKHRYLTHLEEQGFVTKDYQIQEASRFAYITFKRLMYYYRLRQAGEIPAGSDRSTHGFRKSEH